MSGKLFKGLLTTGLSVGLLLAGSGVASAAPVEGNVNQDFVVSFDDGQNFVTVNPETNRLESGDVNVWRGEVNDSRDNRSWSEGRVAGERSGRGARGETRVVEVATTPESNDVRVRTDVAHSGLGLLLRNIEDEPFGIKVSGIVRHSPAASSDLEIGDRLYAVAVGDAEGNLLFASPVIPDNSWFSELIQSLPVGTQVELLGLNADDELIDVVLVTASLDSLNFDTDVRVLTENQEGVRDVLTFLGVVLALVLIGIAIHIVTQDKDFFSGKVPVGELKGEVKDDSYEKKYYEKRKSILGAHRSDDFANLYTSDVVNVLELLDDYLGYSADGHELETEVKDLKVKLVQSVRTGVSTLTEDDKTVLELALDWAADYGDDEHLIASGLEVVSKF